MTTSPNAAPGAAASTDAPDLSANQPGLANPADASNEPTGAAERDPAQDHDRTVKKLERRVGNITRQRYDAEARANRAEEENQHLRAELERSRQPRQGANGDDPAQGAQPRREPQQQQPTSREDYDRAVQTEAQRLARVQEVNRQSQTIADKGSETFGDAFRHSVASLQEEAGPLFQRNGLPTALGDAILDADDPAALLHHLGQDPEEAEKLRGLSPAQLGRRVARLESQISAAPAAPAPQPAATRRPAQGSATPRAKSDAEMSDAEWDAQRRAQKAAGKR